MIGWLCCLVDCWFDCVCLLSLLVLCGWMFLCGLFDTGLLLMDWWFGYWLLFGGCVLGVLMITLIRMFVLWFVGCLRGLFYWYVALFGVWFLDWMRWLDLDLLLPVVGLLFVCWNVWCFIVWFVVFVGFWCCRFSLVVCFVGSFKLIA